MHPFLTDQQNQVHSTMIKLRFSSHKVKVKGKAIPVTRHEGP
jgi:hypothetical protein